MATSGSFWFSLALSGSLWPSLCLSGLLSSSLLLPLAPSCSLWLSLVLYCSPNLLTTSLLGSQGPYSAHSSAIALLDILQVCTQASLKCMKLTTLPIFLNCLELARFLNVETHVFEIANCRPGRETVHRKDSKEHLDQY